MKKHLLAIVAFIGLAVGCASHLQTGGAYAPGSIVVENGQTNTVATAAPDQAFYNVDLSFDLVDTAVLMLFDFERKNRVTLFKIDPEIKHKMDRLRPEVSAARIRYFTARKIYKANPTPTGLSDLEAIITQLTTLSESVKAAVQVKPK